MSETKFVASKELGRLCRWLRILGEDVVYVREGDFNALLFEALRADRIILTRLSKRGIHPGVQIIHITSDSWKQQLQQLFQAGVVVVQKGKLFTRCVCCNCLLQERQKESIRGRVPVYVYDTQQQFYSCSQCGRIYWKGTHWGHMEDMLERIQI